MLLAPYQNYYWLNCEAYESLCREVAVAQSRSFGFIGLGALRSRFATLARQLGRLTNAVFA